MGGATVASKEQTNQVPIIVTDYIRELHFTGQHECIEHYNNELKFEHII